MVAPDYVLPDGRRASFSEIRKACVAIARLCGLDYKEGVDELRKYARTLVETEFAERG